MPWDCGFLCLLTERRRYCEVLWRRRLLITNDERKAKRRFLNLMRGFDSEDLRVLKRAIESCGHDIKMCAPGPPMDLVEETYKDEENILLRHQQPTVSAGCSTTVMSSRARHSISRLERDRMLFQRHKFPELFTPANAPQHSVGAGPPPPLSSAAYPPSEYAAHYHCNNRRRSSSTFNRKYGRDENADLMWPNDDEYYGHQHKPSTSQQADELASNNGIANLLSSQNDDLGLIPQIDRPMSMPYLCCKMWRWKDLQVDAALHRLDPLPWCRFGRVTINNATVSCCNPYHYGLWIRPEHSPSLSSTEDQQQGISGILANGGGHTLTSDTGFADCLTSAAIDSGGQSDIGGAGGGSCTIGHVRSVFKSIEQHIKSKGRDDDQPPAESPPPIPSFGEATPSILCTPNHVGPSQIPPQSQTYAWGRMARWERKQRIGEVVALAEQFVAVGKLAGTVYDGQNVRSSWDIENEASFSLIKQSENANFEDIWLYNSGDRPLFICVSRTLSHAARSDTIRRLLPGYCIRVHRIPILSMETSPPINVPAGNVSPGTGVTKPISTTTTTLIGGSGGRLPIIATTMTANNNAGGGGGGTAITQRNTNSSPKSMAFLTISVGVGWGINYQRLYVTDVPCRYEIIFC